jgi:hypothetical protein
MDLVGGGSFGMIHYTWLLVRLRVWDSGVMWSAPGLRAPLAWTDLTQGENSHPRLWCRTPRAGP